MNFFMELPDLSGLDYEDSYMEFTISGKGANAQTVLLKESVKSLETGFTGFTFRVNAIQMADTITAIFHYAKDGAEVPALKQKDGRYKVTIPDIGAHELGKRFDVTLATTRDMEPATVSITAMSYVRASLGKSELGENERNAMMALYRYYVEAEKVITA